MIKVLFFASLRDKAGQEQVDFESNGEVTVGEIKESLKAKNDNFQNALAGNVLSAVDQEMVNDAYVVSDGSEVAFFPPVTGG